jgi:hypothetical protein
MKKMRLNIVTITLPDGKTVDYYVKHFDPRQAKSWVLENKITARKPSEAELIKYGREGGTAMGPPEAQQDLEDAIDAENRRNAELTDDERRGE